jgi:hypothetical protein
MVRLAGLYTLHLPASTSELLYTGPLPNRPFVGCFAVWDGTCMILTGGLTNIGWMTGSGVVVHGGGERWSMSCACG